MLFAQATIVTDHKGTKKRVTTNTVTTTAVAPTIPVDGDVWFDRTSRLTKIWQANPGLWKDISPVVSLWQAQSAGGVYATNDLVNYNGMLYKNISNTNSDTTPNIDVINWESVGGGDVVPIWKPSSIGGEYEINDLINYNGDLYKNISGTNSDTTPSTDFTRWIKEFSMLAGTVTHSTLRWDGNDWIENTRMISDGVSNTQLETNFTILGKTTVGSSTYLYDDDGVVYLQGGASAANTILINATPFPTNSSPFKGFDYLALAKTEIQRINTGDFGAEYQLTNPAFVQEIRNYNSSSYPQNEAGPYYFELYYQGTLVKRSPVFPVVESPYTVFKTGGVNITSFRIMTSGSIADPNKFSFSSVRVFEMQQVVVEANFPVSITGTTTIETGNFTVNDDISILGTTYLNGKTNLGNEVTALADVILQKKLKDGVNNPGASGQLLSSTVTGVLWIDAPMTGTDSQTLQFNPAATTTRTTLDISQGNSLTLLASGSLNFSQTGTNTLTFIGQSDATRLIDADGDTQVQVEKNTNENRIQFDTTGTERMVITATGKIGIGTAQPMAALDVNSSSQGILLPRISLTNSVTFISGTATESVLVYNTNADSYNTGLQGTGFYYWKNNRWKSLDDENSVPQWKSSANGGSYTNNEVVSYNGELYKNLTATNSDTSPLGDLTNWRNIYTPFKAVQNEEIFDDGTITGYLYVSLDIDGAWQVSRFKKDDPNDEMLASIDNNSSVLSRPDSLSACQGLTFN